MIFSEADAVRDLAVPLPVIVIPSQPSASMPDRERDPAASSTSGRRSPPVAAADGRGRWAAAWLRSYVAEALEHRRRNGLDDLLSAISKADPSDVDRDELVDNIVFLLFAGFETTTSVIATGLAALLERPDQLALLQREPALIPRAVEEFIRYDSPIQSRLRFVHEPITIGDRTIKPGRLLLLLLGSANRDPRQFRRPDDLDVARTPNLHGIASAIIRRVLAGSVETAILRSASRQDTGMEPAGSRYGRLVGPGLRTADPLVPKRLRILHALGGRRADGDRQRLQLRRSRPRSCRDGQRDAPASAWIADALANSHACLRIQCDTGATPGLSVGAQLRVAQTLSCRSAR